MILLQHWGRSSRELSVVGPKERRDCPEALQGFAASPVPTGGDAGCAQDEGIAVLVVCVRPCTEPQGLSLCQGLHAAFCVGLCPWVLQEAICPGSPATGLLPLGKGTGDSPLPFLTPLAVPGPGGGSVPFGAQWGFCTPWCCFPMPPVLPPPPTQSRSYSEQITFNGEKKKQEKRSYKVTLNPSPLKNAPHYKATLTCLPPKIHLPSPPT